MLAYRSLQTVGFTLRIMTYSKYRLIFSGKLLEGFKHRAVQQSLAQLLKIPLDQAGHLIQGDRFRINKPLDREKAERLLKKITARGAECTLEPASPDGDGQEGSVSPAEEDLVTRTPQTTQELDATVVEEEELSLDLAESDPMEELSLDLPDSSQENGLELEPKELPPDDDATRPLATCQADAASEISEDIVLASNPGDRADYLADDDSENLGTFYERATSVESDAAGAARAKRQKQLLLLGGGLLLVVVVAAWQLYPMLMAPTPEPAAGVVEPAAPVDPQLARTNSRLEALNRSIRVWMIQYGSGFNPAQVTLDRLQRDLQIGDQEMVDGWGTALRFEPEEKVYRVVSAGPDRQFGTQDDLQRQTQAK